MRKLSVKPIGLLLGLLSIAAVAGLALVTHNPGVGGFLGLSALVMLAFRKR